MRRDVSAVKPHSFNHLQFVLHGFALIDSDDALLAHSLEGLGHHAANDDITVGGNRRYLLDLLRAVDGLGHLSELLEHDFHGGVDASLQVHGVHASDDRLRSLPEDRPTEDSGGGGTIASQIIGLRGDLLDERGTDVGRLVLKLDCLCNCNAILGHLGCAKALVDHNVAALGSESHCNSICQAVGTLQHGSSSFDAMNNFLGSKVSCSKASTCRRCCCPQSRQHCGVWVYEARGM
mmetsp:Transcript_12027/g.26196  ORF Transcript_12027/g.26196 Transcript_12027/m.26196 type:complete len:235 (-) Transcript_12027:38-742(-)